VEKVWTRKQEGMGDKNRLEVEKGGLGKGVTGPWVLEAPKRGDK